MLKRDAAPLLAMMALVSACATSEPAPEVSNTYVNDDADRKPAFAPTGKPELDAWLIRKRALTVPSR
ncbi:MAG: hypothetical protein AAGD13_13870 [Pseudomonadota bacterium]